MLYYYGPTFPETVSQNKRNCNKKLIYDKTPEPWNLYTKAVGAIADLSNVGIHPNFSLIIYTFLAMTTSD